NPDGVWLAGGGNFDVPGGKYKMQDNDGDGVYEIIVPRAIGFSSFYDFANGPCPDYSCKEDLSGQPCGDPNNYNDRTLPPVLNDVTLETCFGACYTNVECTTGIVGLQKDEKVFDLLGNPPVSGQSIIEFGDQIHTAKFVTLTNTLGETIRHWSVDEGVTSQKLSTAGLPSGLYFVTVNAGNQFYTRKLTKL
ncbi:MAG: T9SS type A sorting domain-containing protein, partial [Saprospiraceae bacterium]